nr:hypothetical protein [Roseateles saccharophilus]
MLDLLNRPKFAARLEQVGLTAQAVVDNLRRIALVVTPAETPSVVPSAPR